MTPSLGTQRAGDVGVDARPAARSGTFLLGGDLPVHRLGFGATRLAPNALAGEPHGAEAEAVDGQVAPQEKGAAPGGGTSIKAGVAGGLSTEGRCHADVNTHVARLVPGTWSPMKRAGFTLIELLTVVVSIALVASLAISKLTHLKTRAHVGALTAGLATLVPN